MAACLCMGSGWLGLAGAANQSVVLYWEMRADADLKLETVTVDDNRLANIRLVFDDNAAQVGWRVADFTDLFTGYIADANIGKDLNPLPGSPVLSRPERTSPLLGTVSAEQPVRIIDSGVWWQVEAKFTIPVFFKIAPTPAGSISQATEVPPPLPLFDDLQSGIDNRTAVQSTAPATERIQIAEHATLPALTDQAAPPQNLGSAIRSRRFEGTFRKSGNALGLRRPPHPFYLEDRTGRRIAWVDVSHIVITGSFKDFIDRPVILFGDMDADAHVRQRVIMARNMRHD